MFNKRLIGIFAFCSWLCSCASSPINSGVTITQTPIPVKVVVVSMFEIGEDEGDTAGEFQLWKERMDLDTRFAFPNSHHDIYMNMDKGVMGVVTGMGTAKSTSAIMALGLDPRFDFSKAYWLVAGIAGIDPEDASIGSAAWAEHLIDGDLAHEIDPREMPNDWKHGYFPLFSESATPMAAYQEPFNGEMYTLNLSLVDWAYELTKDTVLPDMPSLEETRKLYVNHPKAQQQAVVMKGDQLAAMTFWHGAMMNDWANDWVSYWTKGQGEFVTSAMEDTGTYLSLSYLDNIGRVDLDRYLVLRTGSNFTMPPPGITAAQNLMAENEGYAGLQAALESAYLVGSKVVNALLADWATYETTLPGSGN
ncbi:purine nucleoside permease [Teredinibacter turnerae]|uniref:purine nucleoside permease n=1 Tax=Teredinibacter turnerae TaxID=2426 RepID=UPI0003619363|nr:purine nucleoside permease [Teredinibacter turnerae]